jgi:hypothetical protein
MKKQEKRKSELQLDWKGVRDLSVDKYTSS